MTARGPLVGRKNGECTSEARTETSEARLAGTSEARRLNGGSTGIQRWKHRRRTVEALGFLDANFGGGGRLYRHKELGLSK